MIHLDTLSYYIVFLLLCIENISKFEVSNVTLGKTSFSNTDLCILYFSDLIIKSSLPPPIPIDVFFVKKTQNVPIPSNVF